MCFGLIYLLSLFGYIQQFQVLHIFKNNYTFTQVKQTRIRFSSKLVWTIYEYYLHKSHDSLKKII